MDTAYDADTEDVFVSVELPPWLPALTRLAVLRVNVHALWTGVDVSERLASLTHLRELALLEWQMEEVPLESGLRGLPHLTALDLRMPGSLHPGNPTALCVSQLSALHTLKWHPTGAWVPRGAPTLPSGMLELRSLRSLALVGVAPACLEPGPCWAGLTHLSCDFCPGAATLPPALALASALEHLEVEGLAGLDAATCATLARLPALRRLGLPLGRLKPSDVEALFALGQARTALSLHTISSVSWTTTDSW